MAAWNSSSSPMEPAAHDEPCSSQVRNGRTVNSRRNSGAISKVALSSVTETRRPAFRGSMPLAIHPPACNWLWSPQRKGRKRLTRSTMNSSRFREPADRSLRELSLLSIYQGGGSASDGHARNLIVPGLGWSGGCRRWALYCRRRRQFGVRQNLQHLRSSLPGSGRP